VEERVSFCLIRRQLVVRRVFLAPSIKIEHIDSTTLQLVSIQRLTEEARFNAPAWPLTQSWQLRRDIGEHARKNYTLLIFFILIFIALTRSNFYQLIYYIWYYDTDIIENLRMKLFNTVQLKLYFISIVSIRR